MSEELLAEIARLKGDVAKLTKDLTGAHDDLKEVRAEARDRRHENKTLSTQLAELATDRDKFKAAAEADPDNLRKTIDELSGKIRETSHRAAFEQAAKGLKVSDPARVADLWALAGYKPEADQVDAAALAQTIQGALKGRPWLLDQPAPGGATPAPGGAVAAPAPKPAVPGPGADRGESVSSPPSQPEGRIPGRL